MADRKMVAAAAAFMLVSHTAEARLLDPIFADHGLLQRDWPIAIWGEAPPASKVDVSLGTTHVQAVAAANGRWRATLPATKAGGPYTLTAVAGAERLAISDLLVGDVFLCSGQSNMEWPVSASVDGKAEVARSADTRIRLLTIPRYSSAKPRTQLPAPAEWKVAGPGAVDDFSAVCFFMAQHLRRARPAVPIGLIDNSWGGSAISAWLRPDAYVRAGGDAQVAGLATQSAVDPVAANRTWAEIWQGWWTQHSKSAAEAAPWASDYRPDGTWKPVPTLDRWSTWPNPNLKNFVGLVWYRTTATLTPAQAAQAGTLIMSGVDEVDQTWVNGRLVGSSSGDAPRHYEIPAGTLKAGENVVVVNDFNTWGDGGIYGPSDMRAIELADGGRVPLTGQWLYRQVSEFHDLPPRAPWEATAGVGTIQNGMVAPLGSYGIKAAAWYQGESDAGAASAYTTRLQALIGQWRQDFVADLPVAVIQLPDFGPKTTPPVTSDWASLRDSQRRAVRDDPHAALVVTVDLGDPDNLHPPSKRPVAARLARAMEHIAYGSADRATGPLPLAARRGGDAIRISFDRSDGPLRSGAVGPFELCGAGDASCRVVTARVSGSDVLLPAEPAATRIRYCWADSPTCTLRGRTLPATPFELPIP